MTLPLPGELKEFLRSLDTFIEEEIVPLKQDARHQRFFDHRREFSRTDVDAGGVPHPEWLELLAEARRRADRAGFYRFGVAEELGGGGGDNVAMAVVREHLARRGPGLHNELQIEHSVVGNLVVVELIDRFGTAGQREQFLEPCLTGVAGLGFALTEPGHGSDATWMETCAARDGTDWVITGVKRFNTLGPGTTHDLVFARTSGEQGDAEGITAFIVPLDAPGLDIPFYWWGMSMPTEHAELTLENVRVPGEAILGEAGKGLEVAQAFVHENRIRQAACGVGAALFCLDRSVEYARDRVTFGQPLARRQAVQWPLVELRTEAELVRTLIRRTASDMDDLRAADRPAVSVGHLVSMCNYRGNRLACDAADRAMQVHGGVGYTRHEPFEHIYRHHRRYRLTEGSEEMQIRRIAGHMFGYL